MKKILVVEDAHSLRKDILEMLGFEGFEAVGAENGLVGVQRAREIRPDLIICDIMMPVMDGYEVLEELRRDEATAAIPFIFLTARTDRVDIRQGMGLGADDYLTKPFTAGELLTTVHARLRKHGLLEERANQRMETLPHELRTPLNVILGFSDLLMTEDTVVEWSRVTDMARHINSAAMRLFRLTENFLIYSQTEIILSNPQQIDAIRANVTPYPAASIQQHAEARARLVGREDDLRLDIENVEGIGMVEEFLGKVVEELVDNGAKFSDRGTPIYVSGVVEGDRYVFRVKNAGRGMTQDQIDSIGAYMQFRRDEFEQQGPGLGLALVRRLAELHDGDFRVESEPGEWLTAQVALPVRAALRPA